MALLEINAALFSTFFRALLLVLAYCSRRRRYFDLGVNLPGPPALPIIENCLQFTANNLSKLCQKCKEFERSCCPIAGLWYGPVLVVVLTDPNCIESVVKNDKLYSRGYLVRKTVEQVCRNELLYIDGEEWRRHRKIVSAALHINILETSVENFAKRAIF